MYSHKLKKKRLTFLPCVGILITLPVFTFSTFFNKVDTGDCVAFMLGESYSWPWNHALISHLMYPWKEPKWRGQTDFNFLRHLWFILQWYRNTLASSAAIRISHLGRRNRIILRCQRKSKSHTKSRDGWLIWLITSVVRKHNSQKTPSNSL